MGSDSSISGRKKKEDENVVTTCSNYTINNNGTFVTSFFIFGRKVSVRINRKLHGSFRQIASMEGLSASDLLENAITEYVMRHGRGNPQLPLTPYMDPSAVSPMRVLCWLHLAGATSDGRVYCRRYGGAWISAIRCYSCTENQLRKKRDTFQK